MITTLMVTRPQVTMKSYRIASGKHPFPLVYQHLSWGVASRYPGSPLLTSRRYSHRTLGGHIPIRRLMEVITSQRQSFVSGVLSVRLKELCI